MSLADLAATPYTDPPPRGRAPAPEMEWDGTNGHVQTAPLATRPTTWDDQLRESGIDPTEVEVIEPVQVRGWQTTRDGVPVWLHYYRLTVQRRTDRVDIDDLIKVAKKGTKRPTGPLVEDATYVLALGDLQLGKMDGDGVDGTVQRFLDSTTAAVARYKKVAKGRPVVVAHLGDCIEGMLSQGGANAWRTVLPVTEQVRLYRRLLLEQVKAFAAVAPDLTVVGVPGNHDEAHRPLHTYGDSWAIDAISAVRDALDLAGGYGHVNMLAPARDELTATIDASGTRIGMAHGHQWRAGQANTWWAKQAHGRQPVGDADILLSGHFHHLNMQHTGSDKLWLQVPALESGSQWWKHRTGEWGQPGVVTFMTADRKWWGMEVL